MSPPIRSNPYSNVPAPTSDPRQVEGWALTETALRMKAAQQQQPENESALLLAVRTNWRLWTIFQASLLEPDCPLPSDLRSNILSLANFVDKHTAGILADPTPAKLDILIRINRELAGGLLTPPPPAGSATPAAVGGPTVVPGKPFNTRA